MTKIFFPRIFSARIFFPRIFFPRIFSARIFSARIFFPRFFSTLTLAVFLAIFFAVAVILPFSPEAKASEHEAKAGNEAIEKAAAPKESQDKVERKLERAKRLKEKGKLRKATKVFTKAIRTEYKAQKKYQRALELKRRGKFKKYGKKIRRSARLGSKDAQAIRASLDATSGEDADADAVAVADTFTKVEAYALVGEIEEIISANPAISGALRGDADSLYAIGSMYRVGGVKSGGQESSLSASSMPASSASGVEQNLSVAFAMFLHAEKLGSGRASNDLSLLLPALSTAEVDVGRDVYKEWRSIMRGVRKADKKASKADKKASKEEKK